MEHRQNEIGTTRNFDEKEGNELQRRPKGRKESPEEFNIKLDVLHQSK